MTNTTQLKAVTTAEKQLLGALMSEHANPHIILGELILSIRPDWFTHQHHKQIMIVLGLMTQRNDAVLPELMAQFSQIKHAYQNDDEDAIIEDLNSFKAAWLKLTRRQKQPTQQIIEGLIDVIRDRFISNQLYHFDKQVKDIARQDATNKQKLLDIQTIFSTMTESFSLPSIKEKGMDLMDAVAHSISIREAIQRGEQVNLGFPTGFVEFDQAIGGFGIQKGGVYGLGGLSGMGKTTLALEIMKNIAKQFFKVSFYSYEMSELDIQYKLLSSETGIEHTRIKSGSLDKREWEMVTNTATSLGRIPLTYLGYKELKSSDISIFEQRVRKDVEENEVDVIFIDHIALMSDSTIRNGTETDRVTSIARKLSRLAKELNIAIVMLCQLNRKVEERASKRPTSADVKNSGAIWEECDVFFFIHRESRFDTEGESDRSKERNATIIIGKNRLGRENVDVSIIAELEFSRFKPITDDHILPN